MAGGRGGGPLHRQLWRANAAVVEACREHPFVRGLEDGTLDRDAFRRYVAQDAFFLRAFLAAYAVAAARTAGDLEVAAIFHRLIGGVLEELELHAGYAARLDIDLAAVEPYPETLAYTDFLTRTAWTGEPGEILAAVTPCMRLYAHLGRELAAGDRPGNPYREWISTYGSGEFQGLAAEIEGLLDRLATGSDAERDAYRYALECERDFFTAPLESRAESR